MTRIRPFAFFVCLFVLSAAPLRANSFALFPDFPRSGVRISTMVWQWERIPIDGLWHAVYYLAPFPAQIQIYTVRTGRLITTVTTDSNGRFKVPLRPGEYRLVPRTKYLNPNLDPQPGDLEPPTPRYQAAPVIIRVTPYGYKRVQIEYHFNQAV